MQKLLFINQWRINTNTGEVVSFADPMPTKSDQASARIDPQGIRLLLLLAESPRQLVEKDQLMAHVWPDTIVSDDALTRCVSRIRKTLQDDPKQPRIIETLPKRGYRLVAEQIKWQHPTSSQTPRKDTPLNAGQNAKLNTTNKTTIDSATPAQASRIKTTSLILAISVVAIASVSWSFFVAEETPNNSETHALLRQADDYYHQMRRQDNEMAIELYQQAIALQPKSGSGSAGLANALVQQVVRWQSDSSIPELEEINLRNAIAAGRTQTPEAKQKLQRALALAERAVRLSPKDPKAFKALGFVQSASGDFELALDSYQQALKLNPDAWDVLINTGELLEMSGQLTQAIGYYEKAFAAMGKVYPENAAQIHPWYADMGATIGDKHQQLGNTHDAEAWYRHVLSFAPFNANATQGLAAILFKNGDEAAAQRLCQEYQQRVGEKVC